MSYKQGREGLGQQHHVGVHEHHPSMLGTPDETESLIHGHHHGGHESMALGATLHCLTGCAIGELLGMIIGVGLGFSVWGTVVLSIGLAFVFGYVLSAVPVVRAGVGLGRALKLVLLADTLSIASMELAENLVMLLIPGAMHSGLGYPLFWVSMSFAFIVGFAVAYPVNRVLLRKGMGHAVTHEAMGHRGQQMDNKPLVFGLTGFLLAGLVVSIFG